MILILDNGDRYKITDEKKAKKILSIFYNSANGKYDVYAVMSEQQFTLLQGLALYYNLKYKDVFIKFLNDFNLDIDSNQVESLKNKITYNRKYIVRTFSVNVYLYKKLLKIKDMFNLKNVNKVFNILLDFESK